MMIRMLLAIRGTIIRLWNFGTVRARLVIRLAVLGVVFFVVIPLLVWPFVLLVISHVDSQSGTGFTAVAAFLPLVAFLVFAIFSVIFLAIAYPLLSGVLVAIPELRSFLGWFVVALIIAVFGEMAIGLYLAFVPVWSLPWRWIAGLALLVVFLGLWQFLKWRFRWRWGGWVTPTLATVIAFVTIAFIIASFFGGKKEAQTEKTAVMVQAAPRVEEFTLNAGELKDTVLVGPGSWYRIQANKPWNATCAQPGEPFGICQMPAGPSSWEVKTTETRQGLLQAVGVEDGTVIRFERVR